MTNDESALREVDQSLAEDRQWEMIRKNGPMLIGAASVIVLSVAGWQFWQSQKQAAADKAAIEFRDVVATLETAPDEGRDALAAFAAEAPDGYAILAEFRRAASFARSGSRDEALAIYRKIYDDRNASKRLRDLARIRASYLSIENSREEVLRDIGSLTEDQSIFGAYAREISAIAALAANDFETAQSMFNRTALDPAAPETVRLRAVEFAALAGAGKAGVGLTGAARAEDLIDALDRGAVGESHEGHDHGDEAHADEMHTDEAPEAGDAGDIQAETAIDAVGSENSGETAGEAAEAPSESTETPETSETEEDN